MAGKQVLAREITVGQPLPWNVFKADGTLLLRRGFVIDSQRSVDRLIEEGLFLESGSRGQEPDTVPMKEKPPSALQSLVDAKRLVALSIQNIDAIADFTDRTHRAARLIDDACNAHTGVAIASILLLQDGPYAVRHQVNAAIVAFLIGRSMGFAAEDLLRLTAATLTMNISMAEVHDKVNDIRGPLNEKLQALIASHPAQSAQRLARLGVEDAQWLRWVEQHHERENGTGYPKKLFAADIDPGAKIIALADRYCARISVRNYKSPQAPNVVLRDFYIEKGQEIDTLVAAHLLRVIGLYPPGTLVRLRNGEVAVVVEATDDPDAPIAHALLGPSGAALTVPAVRKTVREAFAIVDVLTIDKINFPIQMSRLWGDAAKTF